ncbi:hypothetical protein GTP56_17375 [Duganella sp. FT134W]|uniref:Conjugal transfer protein TrbC n=1 Tax=Duganella margarita TaxID=2692170 RepID=A0A7X4KI69_9BURK|nr:hypothetical protein [Duganella margarita]MYM73957.1 hypothetical protein [Duganella margarita]
MNKANVSRILSASIFPLLCSVCVQASAQVQQTKITENLQFGLNLLVAACVVIFTGFFVMAGIEIGARHKRLIDIWHLLVGAGIAAGAGVYAAQFVK